MDVRTYSDPGKRQELAKLRTFATNPTDSFEPLKEKELLYLIQKNLVARGYIPKKRNPDFLISVDFSIDPVQVSGVSYMPTYTPGTTSTTSGYLGSGYSRSFTATTTIPGTTTYTPIPYSAIVYHRMITLYFKKLDGTLIWQGEAESTGSTSDILVVAPYLLGELLPEFPYKTGKDTYREVPVKE